MSYKACTRSFSSVHSATKSNKHNDNRCSLGHEQAGRFCVTQTILRPIMHKCAGLFLILGGLEPQRDGST